ncbi:LL-diaminopimelate aminotransferase [Hydrogeniiclostridium mannosilyticum]|uniref:LL-diaminopimelate aminotransferase n=1 Tax=Hydrogeniiclostridium mannosilyticum TaxID=2764322 RepID=A0A328UBX3_9FIRM|nr:LL-diaminopimelate aminotransferase [Hydrogeniiclostridium mannosilyticum]RAQ29297.1 LL-diaminopimelate aminotransferase [Hydrogeniiclostridium mannosilyticum]
MKMNHYYADLEESYLFSTIAKKVEDYQTGHPDSKIIRMGIGDVTLPLPEVVVSAFQAAVLEQGTKAGFHGYGPEQGYAFLREAVRNYYMSYGVELEMEDIFISDGAKSDVGNILDLFDRDNQVLIPDPVYPVYRDTNLMAGREIVYLDANMENGFLPLPDRRQRADLIYLCSPNNPTGAVYNRAQLQDWVDYAREQEAVILFDAAYEAFVSDPALPRSIYEIEGARECAVEFCSLSKTAGFTGTRCGYTVVPHELNRGGFSLRKLWLRRQTTKFNGVSYPVQKAAAAVFSLEGLAACRAHIDVYRKNAGTIVETLNNLGIWHVGGVNSPYIWMKCPRGMDSWAFFDDLLERANVVGTPGAGFGKNGEGFFRLTAFNTNANTEEAMQRLWEIYA